MILRVGHRATADAAAEALPQAFACFDCSYIFAFTLVNSMPQTTTLTASTYSGASTSTSEQVAARRPQELERTAPTDERRFETSKDAVSSPTLCTLRCACFVGLGLGLEGLLHGPVSFVANAANEPLATHACENLGPVEPQVSGALRPVAAIVMKSIHLALL